LFSDVPKILREGKTVFLPRTYRRILTFSKNKFYYLSDSGEDGWALHEVDL
jgi:hypothetical protein